MSVQKDRDMDMDRNNQATIVAAVDIGTTKVCAIVAKLNSVKKLEVLGVGRAGSTGVMRGVITNIDKTVEAIRAAIAQAKRQSGVEIHYVYVGIAGQHIKSYQNSAYLMRDADAEEIGRADIQKLMEDMSKSPLNSGEQIIHILPQDFTVDEETGIKDPIGMSGVRLEGDFHIITGQNTAIRNIHRCIEKAGLEVADLILEPLASSASVLSDEEKEAGIALVDIGGGTTDIAIFQEGIIRHTAVIPLGGNIITEDIKEGCLVMREQAEKLKIKFGAAIANETQDNAIVSIPGLRGRPAKEISVKNLAHIIQARMEEILELVYFEIENSGFASKLIGGIVVTGGGASLEFTQQLTEYLTGLDVRVGYADEYLANGKKTLYHPSFATVIGLAIKSINMDEPQVTEYVAPEPEPEPEIIPEVVKEEIVAVEETYEDSEEDMEEEGELVEQNDHYEKESFLGSLIRRSKEWLEGDVKDFK
ncbi:MAG: cell division protein FtsA [Chitinophagales bacterium]